VYEAPAIISTCINCIALGSFGATLALIAIGLASLSQPNAANSRGRINK
jgi:hypothetical protein